MPVDCLACARCRKKREDHLAAENYIECKASENAEDLLAAFESYRVTRRSSIPFEVVGVPNHPHSAWPFLLQPDSIESCAGHLPKEQ